MDLKRARELLTMVNLLQFIYKQTILFVYAFTQFGKRIDSLNVLKFGCYGLPGRFIRSLDKCERNLSESLQIGCRIWKKLKINNKL